jgi:hypothetical protein
VLRRSDSAAVQVKQDKPDDALDQLDLNLDETVEFRKRADTTLNVRLFCRLFCVLMSLVSRRMICSTRSRICWPIPRCNSAMRHRNSPLRTRWLVCWFFSLASLTRSFQGAAAQAPKPAAPVEEEVRRSMTCQRSHLTSLWWVQEEDFPPLKPLPAQPPPLSDTEGYKVWAMSPVHA